MRPRGMPRGNGGVRGAVVAQRHVASMRPRGMPRGNIPGGQSSWPMSLSFNEAAGNAPRKRRRAGRGCRAAPRRFNEAAGNAPRKHPWWAVELAHVSELQRGCGECPAKPPQCCRCCRRRCCCFNEAAGNAPRKPTARNLLESRALGQGRASGATSGTDGQACYHPPRPLHVSQLSSCQGSTGFRALPGVLSARERSRRAG